MRLMPALLVLLGLGYSALGAELSLYSSAHLSPDGWTQKLRLGLCREAVCAEAGTTFGGEGFEGASFGFGIGGDYLSFGAEASFSSGGFQSATAEAGLSLRDLGELGVALSFDGEGLSGVQLSFWLGVSAAGEGGTSGLLLEFDEGGAVTGQVLSFGFSFPPWDAESTAYFDAGGFLSLECGIGFSGEALQVEANCALEAAGLSGASGGVVLALEAWVLSADVTLGVDGSWAARGEIAGERIALWGEVSRVDAYFVWATGLNLDFEVLELGIGVEGEDGLSYSGGFSVFGDTWALELTGSLDPMGYWELLISLDISLALGEERED